MGLQTGKSIHKWLLQEMDYSHAGQLMRRSPFVVVMCECGRHLDELRWQKQDDAVLMVARRVGWVSNDMVGRTAYHRQAVQRWWTRRGRRWICPCGADWQVRVGRLYDAMLAAKADRPIGVKAGDRAPVVQFGVDL